MNCVNIFYRNCQEKKFDDAANSADSETMDSCFRRNNRGQNSVSRGYQEDKTIDSCFRRYDRGKNSVFFESVDKSGKMGYSNTQIPKHANTNEQI
jgi:hypothetical protein